MNKKKANKKQTSLLKSLVNAVAVKRSVTGVLVIVCFFIYVAYTFVSQQIDINNQKAEIEAIDKQKHAEEERQKALADEKKMVNTPEWIEKYARSEMGYAAPDEIVFIDSTVSN